MTSSTNESGLGRRGGGIGNWNPCPIQYLLLGTTHIPRRNINFTEGLYRCVTIFTWLPNPKPPPAPPPPLWNWNPLIGNSHPLQQACPLLEKKNTTKRCLIKRMSLPLVVADIQAKEGEERISTCAAGPHQRRRRHDDKSKFLLRQSINDET